MSDSGLRGWWWRCWRLLLRLVLRVQLQPDLSVPQSLEEIGGPLNTASVAQPGVGDGCPQITAAAVVDGVVVGVVVVVAVVVAASVVVADAYVLILAAHGFLRSDL